MSDQNVTRQVIIVKKTVNTEGSRTVMLRDANHFPYTLDSHLLCRVIRRGDQNLNANLTSDRRAFAAEDERTIQRNVAGEASCRMG